MYDVSKEFRKFYKNHVVLQSDKQQKLREKKDIDEYFKAGGTYEKEKVET